LEEDPSETTNLASKYPEKAKALFESLRDNLKRGASRSPTKERLCEKTDVASKQERAKEMV